MLRAYPEFKNIGKLCALRQRRIAHELNAMAVIVTNFAAVLRLLRLNLTKDQRSGCSALGTRGAGARCKASTKGRTLVEASWPGLQFVLQSTGLELPHEDCAHPCLPARPAA